MATIVGGIATSHTPTIAFAKDANKMDDPVWKPIFEGFEPVQAWLRDKKPDVLVYIYNDHMTAFFDHSGCGALSRLTVIGAAVSCLAEVSATSDAGVHAATVAAATRRTRQSSIAIRGERELTGSLMTLENSYRGCASVATRGLVWPIEWLPA